MHASYSHIIPIFTFGDGIVDLELKHVLREKIGRNPFNTSVFFCDPGSETLSKPLFSPSKPSEGEWSKIALKEHATRVKAVEHKDCL